MNEERERAENEEYLKLKEAFVVEEEGEQAEVTEEVMTIGVVLPELVVISFPGKRCPRFHRLY